MSQFPQSSRPSAGPWQLDYGSAEMTASRFFNAVYAWMAVGLAVTAMVGWLVAHTAAIYVLYANPISYIAIALAAFGLSVFVQSQAGRLSVPVSTLLFLVYSAVVGALTSGIFLLYPVSTLGAAFVLTAGTFGVMSVYGFITKRDLTQIGSMAVMLVFGFIIASIVNIFLASNALSWVITYGVLVLFVIITAYQTQRLKRIADQFRNAPEMAARYAIVGSLLLYISFINMFLSILDILSPRR